MKSKIVVLIITLVVVIMIVSCWAISNYTRSSIAYVEVGILMKDYDGIKQARIEFEKKSKELTAGEDSLASKFEEELKDYEKDRKKLSSKERKLKEELLHVRQKQISNYSQSIQNKLKQEEQSLTQTHLNKINEFLKDYGEQNHYQYILGANGNGNVMYAKDCLNITSEVLDGLNHEYQLEHAMKN